MHEIDEENFLVVIGVGDYNNSLEVFFNVRNIFYIMNKEGQFTDSLVTNKILDYEIILSNIIRIDQEGFLCAANALHTETLDEQLCLFWLDNNLNITNFSFYGSDEVDEIVTDYTINHDGDIVFTGINSYGGPDGETFFWKFDPAGNELEFIVDSSFLTINPTIIQLPGNNNYHVFEHNWVAIYNMDFENDTILNLENCDNFLAFPQRHKIVDDFHYLKIGLLMGSPSMNPWDMGVIMLDEDYQINFLHSYGTLDTNDFANSIDFITTDIIYLGGVKNSETLPYDDGWIALYKTNLTGEVLFSRFYGGYGYYYGVHTIATEDGGCLLAANYLDFYNWVPGEPQNFDVIILKLNENGLLTDISSPVPFEQTDILVYPNPGKNFIKIESSIENLCVQLFDINGKLVLEKWFNSSKQINTTNLLSGNYFYKITQNNEVIKGGKWIKK